MKKLLSLSFIILVIHSCGDQKIDTTKARQEMESREIKRVSEGQIVQKALSLGNETASGFELTLSEDSNYSFKSNSEIDDELGFIPFAEINNYNGKRFQVFDAYAYNAENNITSETGIQILEGDTLLLYTKPAYYEDKAVGIFFIELSRKNIVLSIEE